VLVAAQETGAILATEERLAVGGARGSRKLARLGQDGGYRTHVPPVGKPRRVPGGVWPRGGTDPRRGNRGSEPQEVKDVLFRGEPHIY